MEHGTRQDYEFLSSLEEGEMKGFPDRVLGWLRTMDDSVGYQISRARDEQKRLLNRNKQLKVEGASLKSLSRIEGIATGPLGLTNPEPQQMVHLR